MKRMTSWLLVIFMIMFWLFRVIVAYEAQYEKDFGGFIAFDFNKEVVLLFIVIASFIFTVRRKLLGGLIYFLSYGYYFGSYLIFNFLPLYLENSIDINIIQNALISFIAIIISAGVMFDLALDKFKSKTPKSQKTDWFFQNEQYNRQYDERADKNQYRNY